MAVVAGGADLEGVRVVGLQGGPDVVDRKGVALLGEEAHPEAGEPCEDVFRLAAEVGRDLVLEGPVVNSVDRDRDCGLLCESVGHVLHGLLRDGVRVVGAEADRAGQALRRNHGSRGHRYARHRRDHRGRGDDGRCRRTAARCDDGRQDREAGGPQEALLQDFPA